MWQAQIVQNRFDDIKPFLFIIAIWFVISTVLTLLSGWFVLAKKYRTRANHEGRVFRFATASIGIRWCPIDYRNILFLVIGKEGFNLYVFFPFRFMSPALFIPWRDVDSVSASNTLFRYRVNITIIDSPVKIVLYGKVAEFFEQFFYQSE